MNKILRTLPSLFFALLIGACASTPNPVSTAPSGGIPLADALADPAALVGKPLRWGGELVRIENRADSSLLEILARPLHGSGLPDIDGPSAGRFLARVPGFVDPAAHPAGTRVTVIGRLAGSERGRIGDYEYRYPLVDVETWRDWGVYREPPPDPYYHDPWFWDPWFWGYPWYP